MLDTPIKTLITKALAKTSIDLSQARDFDTIAGILFDFIQQIVPISMAVLYVLESDGQTLKPRACRGTRLENLLKRNLFHLGEGGVGYVGREKKALLLTDAERTTHLPIQIRQVKGEDPVIRSFMAVPLIVNNRLTGVLSVSSSEPNRYTLHEVELVSIVANQVAALVELYSQMEETQRFSDHILENMNSGVIVTDTSGTIIMINRMAEEITGYTHRKVRGKPLLEQAFLNSASRWLIHRCIFEGVKLTEATGMILTPSGEKRSIRLSSSHLATGKEPHKGYIFIFRDVTQIEELNDRLSRYQKIVTFGKWTSCISHEIRNSLLPLRSAVQMLKNHIEPVLQDSRVRDLLEVLETESERMNRFLNELSENREGSEERNQTSFLYEALEETAFLVRSRLQDQSIQLRMPDRLLFDVPLSKDQLKQVFLNLFFNSIDALSKVDRKEGKRIQIHYQQEKGKNQVELFFEDNGTGIPKEHLSQLFDPFFTTKEKGSGLGLYNIQKMLLLVGGDIRIKSKWGKGTQVRLMLPLVDSLGGC
ncbi:MAG: ATP-binding protein [Spirochaetales bacterium]